MELVHCDKLLNWSVSVQVFCAIKFMTVKPIYRGMIIFTESDSHGKQIDLTHIHVMRERVVCDLTTNFI